MTKNIHFLSIILSVICSCKANQHNTLGNKTVNTKIKQAWNNAIHFRGKIYVIETNRTVNWFGALSACIQNSSNLANIYTTELMKELNDNLMLLNTSQHFWIAANALENRYKFVNIFGEEPLNYSNWDECQPDFHKDDERCVAIRPDKNSTRYVWYDLNCNDNINFICEAKKANPTTKKITKETTTQTKETTTHNKKTRTWFDDLQKFFKG